MEKGILDAADRLAGFEYEVLWCKLLADRGLSEEDAGRMINRPKTDVDRKLKTRRRSGMGHPDEE